MRERGVEVEVDDDEEEEEAERGELRSPATSECRERGMRGNSVRTSSRRSTQWLRTAAALCSCATSAASRSGWMHEGEKRV